jgi:hypothetical protein
MSGGFTPSLKRSSVEISGRASFLASEHYMVKRGGITLDASLVTADDNGDKIIEAGTFVAKVTATGKYGPVDPSEEVQTITYGGSGLTDYTLTFDGQTTESISADATAADVQEALEALDNIGPGNVVVTGEVGGPFTVKFVGALANQDVAQMTATPNGGTGSVTIATQTAGGSVPSDGRHQPGDDSGFLLESVNLRDGDVICGLLLHGSVLEARVFPSPLPSAVKSACAGRITFQ